MALGKARVVTAERSQTRLELLDLESWLPEGHRARVVWAFTQTLDLGPLYAGIGSREGEAGRPALDPRVLLALWLYATLDGVGSARHLYRLSESELAYRWLRGGMPLNAHTLSDFRTSAAADLDRLLTESVAGFLAEGLVDLDEIIIDGTKVRASASRGSFKTAAGLAEAELLAGKRIAVLRQSLDEDPASETTLAAAGSPQGSRREPRNEAAAAKAALDRLQAEKETREKRHRKAEGRKGEAKVSLTDPEARAMRFADGATGPGYNMQVAALPVSGMILAILPTDRRNDSGLAGPMVAEIERRFGCRPRRLIADTGYVVAEDIEALAGQTSPTLVYAPVKPDRQNVSEHALRCRARNRAREPDAIRAWRERMASKEGEAIMKRRPRIELVNAHLKARGFGRMVLNGLVKVRAVALLHALAHNLITAHRIAAPA